MKINVSPTLIALGERFKNAGAELYIVGGLVRNAALGFYDTDIDLTSSLTPEEVMALLTDTGFSAEVVNKKLGTLLIKNKFSPETYEYTAFRSESYPKSGAHSPKKVSFVKDIALDAKRRDFTANCIYYDVLSGNVVDLYGGLNDIKNRTLKCVETPEFVFSSDGLRILRFVRMGAELGFSLEEHSFKTAKKMVGQLNDITRPRFHKEVMGMLFADHRYPQAAKKDAHLTAVNNLTLLGAWGYVFPNLNKYVKAKEGHAPKLLAGVINSDFCKTLRTAPANLRLASLITDIAGHLGLERNRDYIYDMLGEQGLMAGGGEIRDICKLFAAEKQVKIGFVNETDKMFFIVHNSKIMPKLIAWLKVLEIANDLEMRYNLMLINNVPMGVGDLKINGHDIKKHFPHLKEIHYGDCLNDLLIECILNPKLNTKKKLLAILSRKV